MFACKITAHAIKCVAANLHTKILVLCAMVHFAYIAYHMITALFYHDTINYYDIA